MPQPIGPRVLTRPAPMPVPVARTPVGLVAGPRPDPTRLPANVLQIGGRTFGKAVDAGDIRELAKGVSIEDATKLTEGRNAVDEIYFSDEDGKHYVLFAAKADFKDVAVGYIGRFNGKRVKIVALDDENNTFFQGVRGTWVWLGRTLNNAFGEEAGKSINGLMSTAIGSFVAAIALNSGSTAATTAKGVSIAATVVQAVKGFLKSMASIAVFGLAAVGVISVFQGVRGIFAKPDMTALEMLTGRY